MCPSTYFEGVDLAVKQRLKRVNDWVIISRENGSHPYIVWCSVCDFYTTAVSSRGMLVYRDAVKLANRHRCGQL